MVDLGEVERKQPAVCRRVRQSAWQDVCRRYMSLGTLSGIQYVFFQAYVPGWMSAHNVLTFGKENYACAKRS